MPVVADAPAPFPKFWLCSATCWLRERKGFYRQPYGIVRSLLTTLLFWIIPGSGFGSSLLAEEGGYAGFFFPRTVTLAVLITSIFANISRIEDHREGFLLGVLVEAISRLSLVLGEACGSTTLGPIQGASLLGAWYRAYKTEAAHLA